MYQYKRDCGGVDFNCTWVQILYLLVRDGCAKQRTHEIFSPGSYPFVASSSGLLRELSDWPYQHHTGFLRELLPIFTTTTTVPLDSSENCTTTYPYPPSAPTISPVLISPDSLITSASNLMRAVCLHLPLMIHLSRRSLWIAIRMTLSASSQ